MSDIFISYSQKDREFAARIAGDLADVGLNVYCDKDLLPGDVWASRLAQEISKAKYVLLLLSPSYFRSEWARSELQMALVAESEGRSRIIPVLIDDATIPSVLRMKQFADLRNDYQGGIALLKKALTIRPKPSEEVRARRSQKIADLLAILLSLLGAAMSATVLMAGAMSNRVTVTVAIGTVAGLTVLIAWVSEFRPHRRSAPIELFVRTVEEAYVDALQSSALNPANAREVSDARSGS